MKKLINKDNKKKKIIMVCVVLLLIAIVYFVPFDFKYVKLKKGYPSVGLSSVEYAERSRTLDDSVCVVLKREGECQKVIQRVSSNQLVSFKCEMSQRKFDFFTTLKWHYYSDEGHYCYDPKWHGVKLPYEDIEKPIEEIKEGQKPLETETISQEIKPITEDNKEPTTETVEIKEEKQENVEPTNENITP